MRRVFLLLALVALTRAWTWGRENPQGDAPPKEPRSCKCEFTGGPAEEEDVVVSGRLKEESFWLDQLEEEVKELKGRFDNIGSAAQKFIHRMQANEDILERLEGSRCGDDEFSCGAPGGECISPLWVCDGTVQCDNGRDEDKETTCKNPAPGGSKFVADLDGNDPCTERKPTKLEVVVLTSEPSEALTSVEHTRISYVVTYNKDDAEVVETLNTEGIFSYGRSLLSIFPVNENRLAVDLHFDTEDQRLARASIFFEATKEPCFEFTMRRVD